MAYTSPAVVIDNGSYTTKAGFALEDLPSLVFSTNYAVDNKTGSVIVGDDEICAQPENEVMTLLDNGLIYNFDNIVHNWQYVYDNIDNHNAIDAKEFPLVLTEQSWNTSKNRLTATQIAFETLEVPIFSLVKTPIAQLYRAGRSTGLVIDVGASVTSVTPILDGIIQHKSCFHLKYAGNFVNLHVLDYLQLQLKQVVNNLLPKQYHGGSDSFKTYYISHNVLQDYKSLALNYQLRNYQLPNNTHIPVGDSTNFLESLFQPTLRKLPDVVIPEPVVDKPHTHGLTNLIFLCLKSLEASLLPPTNDSSSHNKLAKFTEIFKELLSNILITGGTSNGSGLPESIINDIRAMTQQYYSNYPFSYSIYPIRHSTGDSNETWDRQFGAWMGACNLASMLNDSNEQSNSVKIALDNWFVTKADYEELGEDLIVEKFK